MEKNMREKQKLVGRNTCTPTDAPQVRSSVTLSLNREETLSEQSLKTPSNNPDVDLRATKPGRASKDSTRHFCGYFFQFLPTLTHGVSLEVVR